MTGLHGLLLSAFAEAADEPEMHAAGTALAELLREAVSTPAQLSLLLGMPKDVAGAAELVDIAYLAQGLHDWARVQGDAIDPAVVLLLETAWLGFADGQGWRPAQELPLPGMIARRFHPEMHRPSPVTLLLALSREYRHSSPEIAARLAEFDLRPGRGIETAPMEHAGLILLLSAEQ
jgi:hypothetical protein